MRYSLSLRRRAARALLAAIPFGFLGCAEIPLAPVPLTLVISPREIVATEGTCCWYLEAGIYDEHAQLVGEPTGATYESADTTVVRLISAGPKRAPALEGVRPGTTWVTASLVTSGGILTDRVPVTVAARAAAAR